jgi:hypothetical protein
MELLQSIGLVLAQPIFPFIPSQVYVHLCLEEFCGPKFLPCFSAVQQEISPIIVSIQAVLATEYTYPSVSAICSQAVANKWSRLYAVGQSWAACPLSMWLPATFSLCIAMLD